MLKIKAQLYHYTVEKNNFRGFIHMEMKQNVWEKNSASFC